MYPYIRSFNAFIFSKFKGKISLTDIHSSNYICWPWDIDMWGELNNGRALSLFDLGRYGFLSRLGLMKYFFREKISNAVAGVSVRYRHRIRPFSRIQMRTRIVYSDDTFLYFEQLMLMSDGRCAVQSLCRLAITQRGKLLPFPKACEKMGIIPPSLECPIWVKKWIEAESERPWPPELAM